jgi:hypothetical protein
VQLWEVRAGVYLCKPEKVVNQLNSEILSDFLTGTTSGMLKHVWRDPRHDLASVRGALESQHLHQGRGKSFCGKKDQRLGPKIGEREYTCRLLHLPPSISNGANPKTAAGKAFGCSLSDSYAFDLEALIFDLARAAYRTEFPPYT